MYYRAFCHAASPLFPVIPSFFALPVSAHHSAAAVDISKTIEVSGVISAYSFRNPHVYMTLTVSGENGQSAEVEVEAGAGSVIAPLGFTRDSVSVGDQVTVIGNPGRRKPDSLLLGRELYTIAGSYYPLNISSRSVDDFGDAVADSLAGTWFPPRESFFGYLGGANAWQLTEAGKTASQASTSTSTTHKDCIPIGIPGLMVYPVANTVSVYADRVEMDIDWLDAERTIWLDGRDHPDASQTFLQGHSTGHWEGEVLVAETTNFTDHSMGLTMSVPGSSRRKITERFELSEDRKQVIYSGMIMDPDYLKAPVSWQARWVYRPGMSHANEACDLEVARRFLDD